jgi:DNA repair exonuclease SbcCD ATPase subunit
MKPLALYIQNYGSFYGRHHINLADRGNVSVLGENCDDPRAKSNGSGKSTWSDAWDWCWFGEHPRGDSADSVVNDEAKAGCCVTTDLLDDAGRLIRVTRVRECAGVGNGPRLWVDGKEITALDGKETQRLIEQHLGLDRTVFHAAVMFGQEDTFKFADATDGQRKDVLTRILPELAEVDGYLKRVDDLLVAARGDEQRAAVKAGAADAALQSIQGQDFDGAIRSWEAQRAERLGYLGALSNELGDRVSAAQAQVDLARNLPAVPPPVPVPTVTPAPLPEYQAAQDAAALASRESEAASARRNAANNALVEKQVLAREIQATLRRLEAATVGQCSQCGQPITKEHLAKEVALAKARWDAVCVEGTAAKARFEEANQQAQAAADAWTAAVNHHTALHRQWLDVQQQAQQAHAVAQATRNQQVQAAQRAQDAFRQAGKALQQAQGDLQRTQQEAATLAQATNPFQQQRAAWAAQVMSAQVVQATERAAVDFFRKRVQALEFWKVGFGAKGLKSFLLDGKVAEMAAEANRWVSLLTGGTTWVEFSTQRQVGKGKAAKLVEDFSVRVFRSNPDGTVTQRNYRSWSGGEKYRVALGVDFGLARLIAKRARCSYDVLVLDELFQRSLDATGKDAVAELLQALALEKSSIFVIDHSENLSYANLFETRMVVRKIGRRSRVVDGLNYGVELGPDNSLTAHPAFP